MKQHHVIYNQDCTNLFAIAQEPVTAFDVDRMVDEIAEGGADLLLVNPNAQRVNYPSKVWQTFWEGYVPGDRAFFGPAPDAEIEGRERWVVQMKQLAEGGCNYLARALERCRRNNIAPGISVRMNDMHDAPTPGTNLFSRFYMEHPELHLHNDAFCGWSATGLNYAYPAVRAHYLALIEELVRDYDCEILELDFLRFHSYFPREDFAQHCAIMTAFIREVRAMLDATGRRIALLARVAAMPAAAYELGFDVSAWARERLVQGISAGAFLNTQWHVPINEFRALLNDEVALYACTDYTADRRPGLPIRKMPLDPALLRGFASGHLAAGADGVELFNFFCAREEGWETTRQEPSFTTLREMQALTPLRGTKKTHILTNGWSNAETDGVLQVPLTVERTQVRSFQMLLTAEPADAHIEALVVFSGGGNILPGQLWLQVNQITTGAAQSVQALPEPAQDIRQAIFPLPSSALRDGRNELVLRNEGETINVISIDVCVG